MQKIIAKAKFVRMSPRKMRLITEAVKNLPLTLAISTLKALPKRAGAVVLKVLQQAVGNAKNNLKLSPETLSIKSVLVEEGPRFKRRDSHAHGARFDSGIRHKRSSHLVIELASK